MIKLIEDINQKRNTKTLLAGNISVSYFLPLGAGHLLDIEIDNEKSKQLSHKFKFTKQTNGKFVVTASGFL